MTKYTQKYNLLMKRKEALIAKKDNGEMNIDTFLCELQWIADKLDKLQSIDIPVEVEYPANVSELDVTFDADYL